MFKYLTIFTCCFIFSSSVFAVGGTQRVSLSEEERNSKGIFKIHQTNGEQTLGILFEEGKGSYGLVTKHDFPHLIGPGDSPRAECGDEMRAITRIFSAPEERDLLLIQFDQPFPNAGSFPHLPEISTEAGEGYLLDYNQPIESTNTTHSGTSTSSERKSPLIYFSSINALSLEVKNALLNREEGKNTKNDLLAFSMRRKSPELSQPSEQCPQFKWEKDLVTIIGPIVVPIEWSPSLDTAVLKEEGIPLLNGEVLLPSSLSLSNKEGTILINTDNQIQGIFRKKVPGYREDLIQIASCPPNEEGYKAIDPHDFDFSTALGNYKFRVTLYTHPNKSLIASAKPLMVDYVDLSVLYDFAPVLITRLLEDLAVYFSDKPEQSYIFYPAVKAEQDKGEFSLEAALHNVHALTYYYFLPIYKLKDWILSQIELG